MEQAQLPAFLRRRKIEELQPGEFGWTVPWALYRDDKDLLWLRGDLALENTPGGTLQMFVYRSDIDKSAFLVNRTRCPNELVRYGEMEASPIPIAKVSNATLYHNPTWEIPPSPYAAKPETLVEALTNLGAVIFRDIKRLLGLS